MDNQTETTPKKQNENSKNNHKLIIIIVIILFIVIIGITIYFLLKKEPTTDNTDTPPKQTDIKYNTNEEVTQDQNISNITFTNITCSFDGSYSLLEYTITNKTGQTINLGQYEIIVKDKDNNIIANLSPYLDQDITPNEEVATGIAIDLDLSEAQAIELVINE